MQLDLPITNKKFVFKSSTFSRVQLFREIGSFFSCRIITGIIDLMIMWVSVDIFRFNDLLMKIAANIIIIILNLYSANGLSLRDIHANNWN